MIYYKNKILVLLICLMTISCSHRPSVPRNNQQTPITDNERKFGKPAMPSSKYGRPQIPGKNLSVLAKPIVSKTNNSQKLSPQDIFEKFSPAVFMVFTSTGKQNFQGSGFFINSTGLAVSNYHVFKGTAMGNEIIKLQDGRTFKLKDIILRDKEHDIMVFTIEAGLSSFDYLPLSSREQRVGDKAYAIGSPRGLENTFSSGEISQLREDYIIQISVPIDHGSSGGALINEYGEVIGITSGGFDTSGANLNFAVSTKLLKKFI